MATTITINGSVTLDESLGLQNTGVPVGSEDNNDSDVSLGTLQSTVAAFSNRLFNSVATGGLGLSTTFATSNGVAESASNFIQVSGGTVASLGFVDGNGGALPVYSGDPNTGVLVTGFTALDGGAIHLFEDATGSGLGNRMALGVDTQGNVVFAVFMDPTADLTSARVWMVQFEAISNLPDATNNPDNSVNLFDTIGVAASTALTFDFNAVHPGSNLFATVGNVNNALIVIAEHPVIDPVTGLFSTSPNGVIKTSQGGGPTTIGVNSQMFDPGEGAYFTYVKNPDPNFLASATTDLSPTEANDADNILYTGGTNTATSASTFIVQTQGGGSATMAITAFDIDDSPQAKDFVSGLGSGTKVNITSVTITHADGTTESETAGGPNTSNNISFASGVATVGGLGSGDQIAWTTSAPHDRVLIEGVAGKFDIGGFAIVNTSSASVDIGQQLTFEDDGPTAAIGLTGTTVAHDESSGAQTAGGATDTNSAAVAGLFTNVGTPSQDFVNDDPTGNIYAQSASAVVNSTGSSTGTDAFGATTAFSLSVAAGGVDSGLTTTDGTKIFLFSENSGSLIVGRIGATALLAANGQAALAVTINSSSGVLSMAQYASLHHGTAETNGDASEAVSITNTALQAVVTVTDGDGDKATNSVNIGSKVQFLDDGPTAAIGLTGTTVAHDESSGAQTAGGATDTNSAAVAGLFTNVGTPSQDFVNDDPTGNIYAQSASAVVNSTGSSFGADEEGATTTAFSLSVAAGGVDSGLTTTDGTKIFLFSENSGSLIVGRIGATALLAANGQAALAVTINSSSGVLSMAQYASLHHDTASNGDTSEAVSITNTALQAVVTVTDGDGDKATKSVDIGSTVQFLDDGPSIGPIADSTVDFTKDPAGSATKSLLGVVGADQNTAPYVVTQFTPSLTINGTLLHGIASNNDTTITYFADTSGNGIFGDAGDLAFYKLELSQTANSGAGSYTFTVLVNAPPAVLTFDFNFVHPGSNLFATVGDVNTGLIAIAEHPVIDPVTGLFSTSPNGVIKTSQGGGPTTIGVNSQMFDPGEGAYFTFVKNPDPNFLASATTDLSPTEANDADNILYSGGTQTANSASTFIVQTQGNSLATMAITAFDIADSPQGKDFVNGLGSGTPVNITSVLILHANGTTESETAGGPDTSSHISFAGGIATVGGLGSGDKIAWTTSAPHDRVLIEGVAGKFDIGGFQITQAQPTPAQDLPFTVQATDGDGDFKQDSFNVHINGVVA